MEKMKEIVTSAPKVIEEAYSDGVSDTLKEVSKIGVDAVKTIRLALFPLQFTAAAQDRLAGYLTKSIKAVPEENRIAPRESLVLPVSEKLRYSEEDNPITDLFINLLSRGMDKERVGEAHPSFVGIISNIAPDEAILIKHIGEAPLRLMFRFNQEPAPREQEYVKKFLSDQELPPNRVEEASSIMLNHQLIAQPELLYTFVEHLMSLGLIKINFEYSNFGGQYDWLPRSDYKTLMIIPLEFTDFGRLFYSSVIEDVEV